ncbi:DNA repair exonuclease SbcCD nuclease subunit [Fontibacillus panacisegetis]|uniref:DNA repair exonuclease SbcCD nuclease subunit n=1 Tax=Fontibacillus panacisegetis TaxID=670482 RepID=A0A1G7MW59_9BACL|nr:DNA repair exonuclease [Fontibacillus panacisegetis]SDF66058.1 DNA repair exonuclease SbcCD nuclease subunit [Fontibacillus panacisegetis]
MTSFRFIHTADLHLDTPFAGMSGINDRLRRHLQESTFAAFGDLVDLAVSEEVDFIVISGDIYDASESSLRAQLRLKEAWDKLGLHGIPVYVIHGNHDPLSSSRQRFVYPDHVTVFGSRVESATAVRRKDGLPVAVVSGISYPTSSVTENTSLQFHRDPSSSLYHIALLHANVDGQEGHDVYSPCSLSDLKKSGYDYWALGHIHKRQILCEAPWVVYPGNIQGRSMKETGPKGCYLVDVNDNKETTLHFYELDHVRWTETELSIEHMTSENKCKEMLEDRLESLRSESGGRTTIVRLNFTGRGPLHSMLQSGRDSNELLQELQRQETERISPGSASILDSVIWPASFKVNTGLDYDRSLLQEENSFLGELLRLSERYQNRSDDLNLDLDANAIINDALASLMDHRVLRGYVQDLGEKERRELLQQATEMAISLLVDEEPRGGEVS